MTPDEFGSLLAIRSNRVLDARALMARAVHVIADAREQKRRSTATLRLAHENVAWCDHLIGESRLLVDRLHEVIWTIAASERLSGAEPEQVVGLVKGLVVDAESAQLDPADARSLTEDIVRWAIEGYYAA